MRDWIIVFVIAFMLGGPGYSLALGIDQQDPPPKDDVTISWAAQSGVGNTISVQNEDGSGITDKVICTITATGTNDMSMWLQDATDNTTFVNSISAAWVVTPSNSNILKFSGNVHGGPYWRLHTEDSDVDVTNTVAFSCIFSPRK